MQEIKLSNGGVAIVDDEDFETVNQYRWVNTNGYAKRNSWVNGKQVAVYMHRVINKTPDGMHTDHINNKKLDNRKSNLRACTHRQNHQNMKKTHGKHKYKGAYQNRSGSWYAKIVINGQQHRIGTYPTEKQAAAAYDEAAREMFGEFAHAK